MLNSGDGRGHSPEGRKSVRGKRRLRSRRLQAAEHVTKVLPLSGVLSLPGVATRRGAELATAHRRRTPDPGRRHGAGRRLGYPRRNLRGTGCEAASLPLVINVGSALEGPPAHRTGLYPGVPELSALTGAISLVLTGPTKRPRDPSSFASVASASRAFLSLHGLGRRG
jgi:hypothetical protein